MVVDVDQHFAVLGGFANFAEPFETGGVRRNDTVEPPAGRRRLDQILRVEERELLRHAVFVPADDSFALALERERQAELGADAIAVRTNVARDANGFAPGDAFKNPVDDPGMGFHEGGWDRSISSRISNTRLPRSTDTSSSNRSLGVYLRTTARPTMP